MDEVQETRNKGLQYCTVGMALSFSVQVTLQMTQSQSVCLDVEPVIFIGFWNAQFCRHSASPMAKWRV
jgi:hypothetical protein